MINHRVVSAEQWLTERQALLAKEKEFTRLRDELNRQRRELPWTKVEQPYSFDGSQGSTTLADLFQGRSQLVVYHFMFAPEWEAGCKHCSFWADNFDPIVVHLNHRDVSMAAVSRAPYAKLAAYQKRMGWTFRWVSSGASSFNFDFHVSFTTEELTKKSARYNFVLQDPGSTDREGISVFYKGDDSAVYHTYSTYARGIDLVNTAYNILDLAPKGRDEGNQGPFWVRRHDEYA